MQSIVSSDNKKGRNNYIKFERNAKLFNFSKDIGINNNFYMNLKDN